MKKNSKIYIAGHRGLVGSAICRLLEAQGYKNIIKRTSAELDLLDQQATANFFKKEKPEYVFLAAAKVGGIYANNLYRAEFIYQNIQIQSNIIHQSYLNNVKKLLFLGSSCIYPKNCRQPIKEEYLLTSSLEYTNEPYAIAKIAGIKMCESYNLQYKTNFISVMPTNLYGPNDNFDLKNSHVLPAMIRKFHEAKLANKPSVELWGTGKPKREFLYVDDMAKACIFVMNKVNFKDLYNVKTKEIRNTHINIGTGKDLLIKELAAMVKNVVNYKGKIVWNKNYPDGISQKLLDVSKIKKLGWSPKINLKEGIKLVYDNYCRNK